MPSSTGTRTPRWTTTRRSKTAGNDMTRPTSQLITAIIPTPDR
jgi:hypothetical protein